LRLGARDGSPLPANQEAERRADRGNDDVRPNDVQTILRHSKVSTTMDLYVHAFDEDLRGAVGALGS
jgi:integrase